jgi:hypothetical protein
MVDGGLEKDGSRIRAPARQPDRLQDVGRRETGRHHDTSPAHGLRARALHLQASDTLPLFVQGNTAE